MIASSDFPNLNSDNHRVTSPATPNYNCIAWAAGDTERWWQPGLWWPIPNASGFGMAELVACFVALGFEICPDENLESNFEKIALYELDGLYTHAARQLPSGKWSSKLGKAEDIEHDSVVDLTGGIYGQVVQNMRRRIQPGS
jgi:hypothetical protein